MRTIHAVIGGILLLSTLDVRAAAELSPRAVAERFDSLMEAGALGNQVAIEQAKALTIGPARRLFPLLAETQAKVMPFLDTAWSRDTILEERRAGRWSALKVRVVVVFRMPFLGLDSLSSVQAIHLFQTHQGDGGAWKIADFDELTDAAAQLVVRSGLPEGAANSDKAADSVVVGILPISRLAPAKPDMPRVTRMRLRVSMPGSVRDGAEADLLASMPQGPGQRVVGRSAPPESSSSTSSTSSPAWVDLETARVSAIDTLYLEPWKDTLAVYRASTDEIDLTDKMLRTRAAQLKQGSPHDLETARRVHRFVVDGFDYKLGATLFATSREALRDMRGDCSEAAVLTAALLRAAGIPSRVMLGYATLESGVWIGHAWTEAHLGGQWIGVDAALREFPAGVSRVALVSLSGARPMKTEATNLMIRTLANLDIQITGAWSGDEAIPLVEHPAAAATARRFWDQVMSGMGNP